MISTAGMRMIVVLAALGCCGAATGLAPAANAQTAAGPGSTINGNVPTAEGNRWNGLDHQPTPSEVPPIGNKQQARVNRKLNTLDRQLLDTPLPKLPSGAPKVSGN